LSYGTGNISTIALYFCKDEATGFSVASQFDFAYKQTGALLDSFTARII